MRVFFCKYNDPPYVKVEKLEIMVRLATERSVDVLLGELKEYASEVDVDFVRKAVRAIGQAAIKIESAAERCVTALMDLIETRVSYVVQEAVIVIKVSSHSAPSANFAGHFPQVPSQLRGNYSYTVRQPRGAGRARGSRKLDLDYRRVRRED